MNGSVLPARLTIGTRSFAVSDLAARAQFDAELSPAQWASLQAAERDMLIVAAAHAMADQAQRGFDA